MSINVGKIIYAAISDVVNGKCYPLVAENSTTFPFIVYDRGSSTPSDTKDRMIYQWEHVINIRVVAEKYDESIALAEQVINKIYGMENDNIDIQGITVNDDFLNDAYIQNIAVTMKTLN